MRCAALPLYFLQNDLDDKSAAVSVSDFKKNNIPEAERYVFLKD